MIEHSYLEENKIRQKIVIDFESEKVVINRYTRAIDIIYIRWNSNFFMSTFALLSQKLRDGEDD